MDAAADLTLAAVGSGREVSLRTPGVVTVLICLAQQTEQDAPPIEAAVRAVYPEPRDVLVAHVVDLRNVPGVFRRFAEGVLAREHAQAVAALHPGQDATGHVVILPDWQGEVATALGLPDPASTVCGAVLSAAGQVMGTFEGPDGGNVLLLLQYALTA